MTNERTSTQGPDKPRRGSEGKAKIPSKIIYSIKPILTFGRILGIFRFDIKNNELLAIDRKMKCVAFFIMAVCVGARLAYFSQSVSLQHTKTLIDILNDLSAVLVVINYILMFIIHTLTRSHINVRIISCFVDLDSKLQINIIEDVYKRIRKYTSCILLFIVLMNVLFLIWYYIINKESLIKVILVNVMYMLQDSETALVCILIYMFKFRLSIINRNLKKLTDNLQSTHKIFVNTIWQENSGSRCQMEPLALHSAVKLHDLCLAYDAIGAVCSLVNIQFNFHMFMLFLSNFIYILMNLCMFLYSSQTGIVINDLMTTVCWSMQKVLYIVALSLVCERLVRTRNETRVLVNELVMDYALPARARAHAKAFMALIDAWPLRIHVYHMFFVNISMLFKFVSLATTYLVLIMQIGNFK